jgi:hypothetical protein
MPEPRKVPLTSVTLLLPLMQTEVLSFVPGAMMFVTVGSRNVAAPPHMENMQARSFSRSLQAVRVRDQVTPLGLLSAPKARSSCG